MLYLFYIIYQDSLFDLGFLQVKILHPIIYDFSNKCFRNRVNKVTRIFIKFIGLLCDSKIPSSINREFFQKQGQKHQISNFKKQVSSSTPPKNVNKLSHSPISTEFLHLITLTFLTPHTKFAFTQIAKPTSQNHFVTNPVQSILTQKGMLNLNFGSILF